MEQDKKNDILFSKIPARVNGTAAVDLVTSPKFDTIRQGVATNKLTKLSSSNIAGVNPITKVTSWNAENVKVFIAGYESKDRQLSSTTYRLLDALTVYFTECGSSNKTIEMPLQYFMDKCGLRDQKSARQQVKSELDILSSIQIEWQEKDGKDIRDYEKTSIIQAHGIKNGKIIAVLSDNFFDYLSSTYIMPYPKQLYRINAKKNPHSFFLLRKITEHKNMNNGKSNEDIIAVKTLLDAMPDLPKYEDIKKRGKIRELIIEPFERDMDYLTDTLEWVYMHRSNQELTDKELATLDYNTFENLMIKVYWKDYPDRTKKDRMLAFKKK